MSLQEVPFDWEEILLFVEDRSVIPIVGKELLVLPLDGGEVLLEQHLARRLAEELEVDPAALPSGFGLNGVAVRYLQQGGVRRRIYSRIKTIVEERELPIPEPLRQLAEVRDLPLFVSTTFDPLLSRALAGVRTDGPEVRELSFSTHREIEDLPAGLKELSAPHVFRLLGPLSPSMEYAVTDEDVLEFLHLLQSETHRPKILFDEFRQSHLLFLGCGFPNWLARFFLRTVVNQPLLGQRETSEVVADSHSQGDGSLTLFLSHCRTVIYPQGDVVEFVGELHRRWRERRPADGEPAPPPAAAAGSEMVEDAIFISYASEDRSAAERLRGALEGVGLDVWFDRERLEPGDAWDRKIRTNIQRCSLFLPLLSENARRRLEGYFRREWRWAVERAEGIAESVPFVLPVRIDDLPVNADEIPSYFWSRQSVQLAGGKPTAEYLEQIKRTVRDLRLRRAGLS